MIKALQSRNYNVRVYRPNYGEERQKYEKQVLDASDEIRGSFFPASLCGKFRHFFAYIRVILCALSILFDRSANYDFIIIDLLPVPIPILRLKCNKVVYYCHDPD